MSALSQGSNPLATNKHFVSSSVLKSPTHYTSSGAPLQAIPIPTHESNQHAKADINSLPESRNQTTFSKPAMSPVRKDSTEAYTKLPSVLDLTDFHPMSGVLTSPEATQGFHRTTSPESKSVKFLSPIHQVLNIGHPHISSTLPELDRDQQTNPLYATALVHKDVSTLSPPSDSISDKQFSLDAVQSCESLDPSVSEISLSSRRSLPVPLRPGKLNTWTSSGPHSLQDELSDANMTGRSTNENRLVITYN